jgi:phosphatidylinositol alpha-mannosyltransferase
MTIGFILDDSLDRSDGVQQNIIILGKELSKRGHTVHYLVADTAQKNIKNIHSLARLVSLNFNGNSVRTPFFARKSRIKKLLSTVKFDVLHVQAPFSPVFANYVIKKSDNHTNIVSTFHILPYNNLVKISTKLLRFSLFRTLQRINSGFAVSKPALRFMNDSFLKGDKVVPNPIDYDYFNSFSKVKKTEKTIVFVGRFEHRKGVLELIDAYAGLPFKSRREAKLIMCGSGPLLEAAKDKAQQNKLSIDFPGFISEKEKATYLASATIAVFPSISGESFGIVLTEAMSAGAGVTLGGNNPGYASVLNDWPEVLFDPKNINEFTAILDRFLSDASLRRQVGNLQAESVKQYDVKKVVDTLEKYYTCHTE